MATLAERAKPGFKKKEDTPSPASQGKLLTRHSDGVIEARDGNGRMVAHYNPKTNETRDARGDLIGKGNRLAWVLQNLAKKKG